jgi:hypothetical protein
MPEIAEIRGATARICRVSDKRKQSLTVKDSTGYTQRGIESSVLTLSPRPAPDNLFALPREQREAAADSLMTGQRDVCPEQ